MATCLHDGIKRDKNLEDFYYKRKAVSPKGTCIEKAEKCSQYTYAGLVSVFQLFELEEKA